MVVGAVERKKRQHENSFLFSPFLNFTCPNPESPHSRIERGRDACVGRADEDGPAPTKVGCIRDGVVAERGGAAGDDKGGAGVGVQPPIDEVGYRCV